MKVGLRFNLVSGDVLLAGMGFASFWRHGDRASVADSAGPVIQILAGLTLLAGLAGTFVLPAMSRRRRMREQGSGLTRATARSPVGGSGYRGGGPGAGASGVAGEPGLSGGWRRLRSRIALGSGVSGKAWKPRLSCWAAYWATT